MDSAAAARPDEEEARRRRTTDCIYFLASPLTCKKGSECDYRHSDAARMNPRDCWYWFHGNCSNPKCSFRHPPLDNLLGPPPTTPRGAAQQQSAPPQVSAPAPAQAHGSVPVPAKQGVPCYYFQKGMCAKGDRCAFLHVPQSSAASGNPPSVFTPATLQSKNSWIKPISSSSQQNTPAAAVGLLGKPKVSGSHQGNKPVVQKQNLTGTRDGNSYAPKPHRQDELNENGMEVGEFVREGSGVIVGGVNDDTQQPLFKGNHSAAYHHHRTNGESERSYRGSSAEAERLPSDKRVSQREHMTPGTGTSDLRHRLLKQRKLNNNNSRSTEAPARHDTDDEHSDQHRWRVEQHDSISRPRLRDRIRLPGGETSFDRLGGPRSEEWGGRGSRARLSPPKHSDLRGKLHERLKATRSAEEIPGNAAKCSSSGEDAAASLNFAGPKSLAELKAKKGVGSSSGEDSIIKGIGSSRLISEIVSSRETAAPFESPKPLSAILKRKREAASGSVQEAEVDAAGVEEESQILTSDMLGENINMEVHGEEEEAFPPEDDVAYDDNADEAAAAAQETEEHQDAEAAAAEDDYDYEAEGAIAEEDNGYQEYQDDDDDLEDDDDDDFARKVGVMMS